jgi:hypothetical protein
MEDIYDCDICASKYIYNQLTKTCDPPVCADLRVWNGSYCVCNTNYDY